MHIALTYNIVENLEGFGAYMLNILAFTDRSVSKVNDEWFADEGKVRRIVGLLENHVPLPDEEEVIKFHRGRAFSSFRLDEN